MNGQILAKIVTKDGWVLLGVAVVMLVAATAIVYYPQSSQLQKIRTQIVTEQRALEADAQLAQTVPDLIVQLQALKTRYRDFDRKLPKSQELHEFLRQISGYLGQKELRTDGTTREEYFNTLPITLKFKSSYLNLAGFLERVENMERLSRVQKLIINRDDKNKSENGDDLDVELQMNIYFTET
jgi:Tfp pilus assembly protein PilO